MSEYDYLVFLGCIWLFCLTVLMLDPLSDIGEGGVFGAIIAPLVSALTYFLPLPEWQVPLTWLTPVVSASLFLISAILLYIRSLFIKDCE
ncbi:hypothetical protein [Erwinia mallotivora]|uniref:Uncharacterized protein n=1 Tax=Erwinia mallotivora TaxID=69222 RepID=A0A014NKQ1_9GAMM|nr:hypothetical protein [Erwinia mallotivora]EXU74360.1 hypothetical protein BG55_18350 [Erwinia mallotivora]